MKKNEQEVTVKEEDFGPVEKIIIYGSVNIVISTHARKDKCVHVKTSLHKNIRGNISFVRECGILEIRSFMTQQVFPRNIKIINSTIAQVSTGSGDIQVINVAGKPHAGSNVQIICNDDESGDITINRNNIVKSLIPEMEIIVPKGTEFDFRYLTDGKISYK